MLKPHHAASYGLAAAAIGLAARGRTWPLAGVLALLAWVFLLSWAYLLPGLMVGALLLRQRRIAPVAIAVAVSVAAAAPYVLHLAADYAPSQSHGAATHMWSDPQGLPLAVPTWSTIDLGP